MAAGVPNAQDVRRCKSSACHRTLEQTEVSDRRRLTDSGAGFFSLPDLPVRSLLKHRPTLARIGSLGRPPSKRNRRGYGGSTPARQAQVVEAERIAQADPVTGLEMPSGNRRECQDETGADAQRKWPQRTAALCPAGVLFADRICDRPASSACGPRTRWPWQSRGRPQPCRRPRSRTLAQRRPCTPAGPSRLARPSPGPRGRV